MIMLGVKIRNLESRCGRIVWFRTLSGRKDPRSSFAILHLAEIRTKKDMRDVSMAMAIPPRERCKIAASECRLPYIDFHADCRRDCCSDATEDYYTACNTQTHVWISGG